MMASDVGPDDQLFFELLAAAVRHIGDLRREPLDVLRLLRAAGFRG